MSEPQETGSEHCECPIRHDYPRKIASCNAESPKERICSRPDGHDGPHAACAPNAHPIETWGGEAEAMADGRSERREPDIFDVVELPESEKGAACPMLTGEEARRCNDPVEFVFVQDANADPDDDRRQNMLCCADCKPEPNLATDGGEPQETGSEQQEPGAGEGERILYEYTDPLQSTRYRIVEELNPNPEHGIAYDLATYARPLMDDEWQDRGVAHARDVNVLPDPKGPEECGTEQECPNCGGTTNQSEDGESRTCWKCGTRWSP